MIKMFIVSLALQGAISILFQNLDSKRLYLLTEVYLSLYTIFYAG